MGIHRIFRRGHFSLEYSKQKSSKIYWKSAPCEFSSEAVKSSDHVQPIWAVVLSSQGCLLLRYKATHLHFWWYRVTPGATKEFWWNLSKSAPLSGETKFQPILPWNLTWNFASIIFGRDCQIERWSWARLSASFGSPKASVRSLQSHFLPFLIT